MSFLSDPTLLQWRDDIEQQLAAAVAGRPDCPGRLRDAMAYSLLAGGKRLRPLLVLMACEACGGSVGAAMPAALAIEMVHTYSLIHDDLPAMDDDDLRRGRPTCHLAFDEATAILAGDGLLTLAFETLARGVRPADVAAVCCGDLAGAAGWEGMVGGQMADLESERGIVSSDGDEFTGDAPGEARISHLESIHRRKTGRLLACAVTMGGRIAGADPQTLRGLQTYGESIGLAFQIADDLLDVGGDVRKIGKQVGKDTQAGKLTYPAILGDTDSRDRAEQLIHDACEALAPLGPQGRRLEAVAHYIIERDH
jgi:geranylgeranyl diphosphate synthase, type II